MFFMGKCAYQNKKGLFLYLPILLYVYPFMLNRTSHLSYRVFSMKYTPIYRKWSEKYSTVYRIYGIYNCLMCLCKEKYILTKTLPEFRIYYFKLRSKKSPLNCNPTWNPQLMLFTRLGRFENYNLKNVICPNCIQLLILSY